MSAGSTGTVISYLQGTEMTDAVTDSTTQLFVPGRLDDVSKTLSNPWPDIFRWCAFDTTGTCYSVVSHKFASYAETAWDHSQINVLFVSQKHCYTTAFPNPLAFDFPLKV